jgi:hypothetical protein
MLAAKLPLMSAEKLQRCSDVTVMSRAKAQLDMKLPTSEMVDGLSRGRSEGPWQRVVRARLPDNLQELLAAEESDSNID